MTKLHFSLLKVVIPKLFIDNTRNKVEILESKKVIQDTLSRVSTNQNYDIVWLFGFRVSTFIFTLI